MIGWALETNKGQKFCIAGGSMVDGDTETNDFTRAERGVRIAILAEICHVAQQYFLQKGHVRICIDNTTALSHGRKKRAGAGPFEHLSNDYGLKCWVTRLE